jgi:preprotein translocase subunit SecG
MIPRGYALAPRLLKGTASVESKPRKDIEAMRIVTIILATLFLLAATGLGLLGTNRSIKDAKDIDSIYKPAKAEIVAAAKAGDTGVKKIQEIGEKTGALRAGAVVFALASLASLALLVMTYMNKKVPAGAVAVVGLSVLAVVVNPQYDLGPLAPASARSLAYVVGVLAALGAACAYGASALKRRA